LVYPNPGIVVKIFREMLLKIEVHGAKVRTK